MPLPAWAIDTVVRVRRPQIPDGHGNLIPDPDITHAAEVDVDGCDVQPGSTSENREQRDAVLIAWTVLAPYGADIRAGDEIRWAGTLYRIVGAPTPWRSLTGNLDHLVVLLQHWEG